MTSAHAPYVLPPEGNTTLDDFRGLQDGPKPSGKKRMRKRERMEAEIFMRYNVGSTGLVDNIGRPFTDAIMEKAIAIAGEPLFDPPLIVAFDTGILEIYHCRPLPGNKMHYDLELYRDADGRIVLYCPCQRGSGGEDMCSHHFALLLHTGLFPVPTSRLLLMDRSMNKDPGALEEAQMAQNWRLKT